MLKTISRYALIIAASFTVGSAATFRWIQLPADRLHMPPAVKVDVIDETCIDPQYGRPRTSFVYKPDDGVYTCSITQNRWVKLPE